VGTPLAFSTCLSHTAEHAIARRPGTVSVHVPPHSSWICSHRCGAIAPHRPCSGGLSRTSRIPVAAATCPSIGGTRPPLSGGRPRSSAPSRRAAPRPSPRCWSPTARRRRHGGWPSPICACPGSSRPAWPRTGCCGIVRCCCSRCWSTRTPRRRRRRGSTTRFAGFVPICSWRTMCGMRPSRAGRHRITTSPARVHGACSRATSPRRCRAARCGAPSSCSRTT